MPLSVFALVMLAALLHATWNAIVKGGGDKLLTTILISGFSGFSALLLLPFMPQPAAASWPFILASVCCQVTYFSLIARAYHIGDMSQTYPLMRGVAPLIVAVVSFFFIGEDMNGLTWAGIGVICVGVLALAYRSARSGTVVTSGKVEGSAVKAALTNACVIAAYTLIDGHGVRLSGAAVTYTLWVFFLTSIPLVGWGVFSQRERLLPYLKSHWMGGLIGGLGTSTSYALSMWAMTLAPVAVVAALRETSILFGVAISALVLGESVGKRRLFAAGVIACGVIVLRLA